MNYSKQPKECSKNAIMSVKLCLEKKYSANLQIAFNIFAADNIRVIRRIR